MSSVARRLAGPARATFVLTGRCPGSTFRSSRTGLEARDETEPVNMPNYQASPTAVPLARIGLRTSPAAAR